MGERLTCAELVVLVRDQGPQALHGMRWLGETTDAEGAAQFTGLSVSAVRMYHGAARRRRARGESCRYWPAPGVPLDGQWMWPEPDKTLGRRPGWKLRTLVLARAAMPGRGYRQSGRTSYDGDTRERAVCDVLASLSHGGSRRVAFAQAARRHGVNPHTLRTWVSQATRPEEPPAGQSA